MKSFSILSILYRLVFTSSNQVGNRTERFNDNSKMYLSDLTTTSVISLLHLDNGKTKNTFKPTLLQTLNYITDTVHKVSMDEIKVHTETDGLTMQENVNNGIVQIGCRYFGSFEKLKHTKLNISHSNKNTQECDNNTKGQCESIMPAIKHGHVINVCGEHSNGLYIVCFRNYLTSCAFPFDIHANINGLFSYKTENKALQRKIAAMTIDGKLNIFNLILVHYLRTIIDNTMFQRKDNKTKQNTIHQTKQIIKTPS